MRDRRSEGIRRSWNTNASAWIGAVREGRIESRVRVTDRAILDAVLVRPPHRVLDLGCGEGWQLVSMTEPARPDTGEPVSLLIECVAGAVTEASV